MTSSFGGTSGTQALLPLSGHIDTPEQGEAVSGVMPTPVVAQPLPVATTLTTIRATFTLTTFFTEPFANATFRATVWRDASLSGTSTPTPLTCSTPPTQGINLSAGTRLSCTATVDTPLTDQDVLFVAVSVSVPDSAQTTSTVGVSASVGVSGKPAVVAGPPG